MKLPGGAKLLISETPALVAIDVDTGAAQAGSPARLARDVNLAAIKALPREFRRRGLAGQIVIDVVPMKSKKDRHDVLTRFKQALEQDPNECHVLGYSGLGLIEMTRRRSGPSLRGTLGQASSFALSAEAQARAAIRDLLRQRGPAPVVYGTADVLACLKGTLAEAVKEVEARMGVTVRLAPLTDPADRGYRVG